MSMYKSKIRDLLSVNDNLKQLYKSIGGEEFMTDIPIYFKMFPYICYCEEDIKILYSHVLKNFEFGYHWIADAGYDNREDEEKLKTKLCNLKLKMNEIIKY